MPLQMTKTVILILTLFTEKATHGLMKNLTMLHAFCLHEILRLFTSRRGTTTGVRDKF